MTPIASSSRGVADARELEQLRGVDRPAAQQHLAGLDPLRVPAAATTSTPTARVPVEVHVGDQRPRADLEVGALLDRMQVGAGGAQSVPAIDVAIKRGKALLAVAVDVLGERIARLLHGGEEGLEQRVDGRTPLELERPVVAAPAIVGRRVTAFSIRLKYGRQWA